MAELLVRNIDKINLDSTDLNTKCFKRGDVIVVQEDGWGWSPAELAGSPWTVVKFPDGSVSAANSYLPPVYAAGPDDSRVIFPRAFYFDLDAAGVSPAAGEVVYAGGDFVMLSYKVEKGVVVNPNVFV